MLRLTYILAAIGRPQPSRRSIRRLEPSPWPPQTRRRSPPTTSRRPREAGRRSRWPRRRLERRESARSRRDWRRLMLHVRLLLQHPRLSLWSADVLLHLHLRPLGLSAGACQPRPSARPKATACALAAAWGRRVPRTAGTGLVGLGVFRVFRAHAPFVVAVIVLHPVTTVGKRLGDGARVQG